MVVPAIIIETFMFMLMMVTTAVVVIIDYAGCQALRDTDQKHKRKNLRNTVTHFYPPSPLDDDVIKHIL